MLRLSLQVLNLTAASSSSQAMFNASSFAASVSASVSAGHALQIIDALKKHCTLGVVPQQQPSKRLSDVSLFMELRQKHHRKEARQ